MANPQGSNQSPSSAESPEINQDVKGDRNQVIGQANYSQIVQVNEGGKVNVHQPSHELDTSIHIPNNLPRSGAIAFVGRDDLLSRLDEQLQGNERIGITGVRGMGGIGKTELALQYAIAAFKAKQYAAGICWLQSRDQEIATQIVSFARANLGIKPPDDLEADEQVRFTWQRWPEGDSLIVLDDVTDYDVIAPYLPPSDPRFKVLITTRINLGFSVKAIEIEELTDESAIALLKSIVGDERIESQLSGAQAICEWVGNLPLGLELLGRFLVRKPDWTIAKLMKQLESKRLEARALVSNDSGMTASFGIAAALELSWVELNQQEQDLACLLGMFAVAPIPWSLVEQCFEDIDRDDLEDLRDDGLRDRSLIKRVDDNTYQLHQIVQEFFREKLKEKGDDASILKTNFGRVMVAQAKILDTTPTLEQIESVRGAITHLEETLDRWLQVLSDEETIWLFFVVSQFHQEQGNFDLAEKWYRISLTDLKQALGPDHPNIATSIDNLAGLYRKQGRFGEAEPLFLQALELRKQVLGNNHLDVTQSLNNLGLLYFDQGRFEEAEPLFLQALELRKQVLCNDHPKVASSLNNLATLYYKKGRFGEAEPLFLQALELWKQVLGNDHPDVAQSLNNLGLLYADQGRFEEAEPLLLQALQLRQRVVGIDHSDVAQSVNNLAIFYYKQGSYKEAEPLLLNALELDKKLLGEEHPSVAISLNNLATLYRKQGRYAEAEPLYLQAIELWKKVLGVDHPNVASGYLNFGVLYDIQGMYQKAKSLYLPALEIYQKRLGNNHSNTQTLLAWLNKLPEDTEPLPLEDLGL